jgi:hypothetical protein
MTSAIFKRLGRARLAFAVVLFAATGAACPAEPPSGPAPAQLVIIPESVTIARNDSVDFVAIGFTEVGDTADIHVVWTASSGSVNSKGKKGGRHYGQYKNKKCGDYQVTATSVPDDMSASASVRVACTDPGPVASVTVTPESVALEVGESVQLSAELKDANGLLLSDRATEWATSNAGVASVDGDGLVTGRGEGSATITASSEGVSGTSAVTVGSRGTRIAFSESYEDFPNPDRGMLRNTRFFPDRTDFSTSHESAETMIWVYYMLEDYRDRPIDAAALARISETFDKARDAGLKILPLFTYNYGLNEPDAPLSQVLEHISQLKPILQAQSDVIASFLLGFVGAWGEWHGSTNNLTEAASQKAILDATVDALPVHVPIQLRYPRDKKAHYGGPLGESEAFSGTAAARIGHHNLCFLAADDDLGTYRSTPRGSPDAATIEGWKDFIGQEGRFLPVGGETCRVNEPRSLCPTALAELEWMRWSWMNRTYYPDVLDRWVADGCMDTIRKRLGYRIVLREAQIPLSVRGGEEVHIEVVLDNVGYAAMYRERPLYVVIEGAGTRHTFHLPSVDPRRWEPGTGHVVRATILLPDSLPAGTYSVGIWLPDRAASLRDRPEYAVRFANQNVWNAAKGVNVLTTDLEVR